MKHEQWDCLRHTWVPWWRPRFTPLHNTLLRFMLHKKRWGIIVLALWVFPLRRAKLSDYGWEILKMPNGDTICRNKGNKP